MLASAKPGARSVGWVLALLTLLVPGACRPPASNLPAVEVTGDAASGFELSEWEAVRSFGVVVKWTVRVTRRSGPALGTIDYALLDPSGNALSSGSILYRSAYDYRDPLLPGDSFTLSVPAYRGESTGNVVQQIRLRISGASTGSGDVERPVDPFEPGAAGGPSA